MRTLINVGVLRLAWTMVLDARSKSVATLAGVVVSVLLMAQQLSILLGILARVTAFSEGSDVDLWVTSAATESTDVTGTLPEVRVAEAASTPGVAWAAPLLQGMSTVARPDGVQEIVKVIGVEAPRYAGLPRSLSRDTNASALRGPGRIFLNRNDRPVFGFPRVGERLEIDGHSAFVGGYFEDLDPHASYGYVFANIEDARAYTRAPTGRTTFVAVGVASGFDPVVVSRSLAARLPDVRVFTRAQLTETEAHYFLARTPVGLVFGMGTVIAALIGALIVAITQYSSVLDRLREYGTLKAIGCTRRDLVTLMLAQAWMFYAAGAALGLSAFFVIKHLAKGAPMQTAPWMFALVLGVSLASCTLASLFAIRRVLAVDPAIVFRG